MTSAIVAVAVAARVVAALALGDSFHFIDEALHLDTARRLLAGAGYGAAYANVPGYPVILAVLAAPWRGSLLLVRCAQAVATGVGATLVIALGARTFGPAVGLAAGAFYAVDPLLVVTGALLYPEATAALVLTATLLAAWTAARPGSAGFTSNRPLVGAAVAGVLLGAVTLCRPVALVVLPVVALWIAAASLQPRTRRLQQAAALVACCIVAITPWAIRNYRIHGHVVPVATAGLKSAPASRDEVASKGLAGALLARAGDDPIGLARHVGSEFRYFWELYPTRLATDDPEQRAAMHASDERVPLTASFRASLRDRVSAFSFGVELAFAIAGAAIAWRRDRAATVLLLAVTLAYGLGFALFVAKLRYRIAVLPCVLLLSGVGASAAVDALARRRR